MPDGCTTASHSWLTEIDELLKIVVEGGVLSLMKTEVAPDLALAPAVIVIVCALADQSQCLQMLLPTDEREL